jgi:hypothetical protein
VPAVDQKETVQTVEKKVEEKKKLSQSPPAGKGGEQISQTNWLSHAHP